MVIIVMIVITQIVMIIVTIIVTIELREVDAPRLVLAGS